MLGLLTHEPNFFIIRGEHRGRQGGLTRNRRRSTRLDDDAPGDQTPVNSTNFTIKFSIVKLAVFREFLNNYMKDARLNVEYNLENVIDDFVLDVLPGRQPTFCPTSPALTSVSAASTCCWPFTRRAWAS